MRAAGALTILLRLQRRWTWIQRARLLLVALATATIVGGVTRWLGSPIEIQLLACTVTFGLAAVLLRRPATSPVAVALYLNRHHPILEESCQLLLEPEDRLPLLQRLQRRKVGQRLEQLTPRPALPLRSLFQAVGVAFAAALLAGFISSAEGRRVQEPPRRTPVATSPKPGIPVLESLQVEISPPPYTGRRKRSTSALQLEAEVGSQINWRLGFRGEPVGVQLRFAQGPTLKLSRSGSDFAGGFEAVRSALYRVEANGPGGEMVTDWQHLGVIPDAAPRIRIVSPPAFTAVPKGGPGELSVAVIIEDDYGLSGSHIVATVGKGSGENIRFRDTALRFQQIQRHSDTRWEAQSRLSLSALQMEPGDELYFHVEARDNRPPGGQTSRSDTRFVRWEGELELTSSLSAGLQVYAMPEYFRSQRQIILDTEKLLRDEPSLSRREFETRSDRLGLDQQALRLRYGQFLGEETSEDPEHAEEPDSAASAAIIGAYGHSHDTSLEATFFSDAIRAQLKAALSQMWESEGRLRTFRPADSLPFQYRALNLLKEVQQRSRLYVKKAGFEPPPISVAEKRLSGELGEVRSTQVATPLKPTPQAETARRALATLDQLESGHLNPNRKEFTDLEKAGDLLARLALEQPAHHLESLNQLRKLLDSLNSSGSVCKPCISEVRRGLWALLPERGPRTAPGLEPGSSLAGEYYTRLEARQ